MVIKLLFQEHIQSQKYKGIIKDLIIQSIIKADESSIKNRQYVFSQFKPEIFKNENFIIYDEKSVFDDVDLKMKTEKLYEYIENIKDERKKKILIMRYGLYDTKPYTQREIAKELDISRSYVSRIETKAIEELRDLFEVEDKE